MCIVLAAHHYVAAGTYPAAEFGLLADFTEALRDHTKAKVQSDFSVGATGAFPGRDCFHRGEIKHVTQQSVQGCLNGFALKALGRESSFLHHVSTKQHWSLISLIQV